jgi:glucosyl-3-phosphoglycerate synthase
VSDFAQSGLISTFQQLNAAHAPQLELELGELSAQRPIALVLPCHGGDLDRPALEHILDELQGASFLQQIVVSLNGLDAAGYARARTLFSRLPQPVRLLWNDGPGTGELLERFSPGKGLNVWVALGLLCEEAQTEIIALQDCDVTSFRRSTLARLCYACAHPQLAYSLAKMFYSRATDRLYGRVSRLFFAPLLHAIVRLHGHQPLIEFLLSFRYPLAGECALTRELASQLPLNNGWGLETGMLCELFRHVDPRQVAQVDGGSGYDHKHQPAAGALETMSAEIARTLFVHLAGEGLALNAEFLATVTAAYRREATLAVRRSANLALINGLSFDQEVELGIVERFAAQLENIYPGEPPAPALPSWSTLKRTEPEWVAALWGRAPRMGSRGSM